MHSTNDNISCPGGKTRGFAKIVAEARNPKMNTSTIQKFILASSNKQINFN